MDFRIEEKEEFLWLVMPATTSAILAAGSSHADALKNFREAVEAFIEQEIHTPTGRL